jgi:hypothetical protein
MACFLYFLNDAGTMRAHALQNWRTAARLLAGNVRKRREAW